MGRGNEVKWAGDATGANFWGRTVRTVRAPHRQVTAKARETSLMGQLRGKGGSGLEHQAATPPLFPLSLLLLSFLAVLSSRLR
jgi:hypothetical protein